MARNKVGVPFDAPLQYVGVCSRGIDFLRDQVNTQAVPDASGNVYTDCTTTANGYTPSSIPLESVAGMNNGDSLQEK